MTESLSKPWKAGRNVIFQCRKTGHEWTASQWRGSQGKPSCPIHRRKNCVQVVGVQAKDKIDPQKEGRDVVRQD